LDRLNGTD